MNQLQNFTVYRDGDIDPDWLREQRIESVKEKAGDIGTVLMQGITGAADYATWYAGALATNIGREIRMGIFDAVHGTDIKEQYHTKLERQKRERFAQSIGL